MMPVEAGAAERERSSGGLGQRRVQVEGARSGAMAQTPAIVAGLDDVAVVREAQPRRSESLARRRARPHWRSSDEAYRRAAAVELEGDARG